MANIKSQIKRNRQNEQRRITNRVYRGAARTAIKKTRAAFETNSLEPSKAAVLEAISMLDKAAQKGILHKNNAARRKSRLVKRLAAIAPTMTQAAVPVEETPAEAEPVKKPARRTTRTTRTTKKPAKE
ncbi:30S ribosomal protein S20 [bacterium]|nr:30S ribosomal protein S20 [bacterium]PIZ25907.1 MAG: 30S ribosomal protein S20 [Chloroflexi bacterium CG_4_10_14_0_8_um_filter_57_5]